MAVLRKQRSSPSKDPSSTTRAERPEWAALAVFGLIVTLGPLAFGAVDRLIQVGVLVLFALGLLLRPPEVLPLSRRSQRLLLIAVGVLLLKELLPAVFFGGTEWRTILHDHYGLQLSWMHHPEIGRAVEGWASLLMGVFWFLWVRTLAGPRSNRTMLAWALFASAAIVAVVSFRTRGMNTEAIYGLRYSPGWQGFGPFPNRNHTATLLAMGSLMGCGCLVWAAMKRKWIVLAIGVPLFGITLAGLLATQSRGGLLAFGAGALIYMGLALAKLRSRRAVASLVTATLLATTLALIAGGPVLKRFSSGSNHTRREVWHDAAVMWRDAPLLGHGIASFASVFPIYQSVQVDNQEVIHPESSWWQWMTELGLVPVAAGVGGLLWFLARHMRLAFARHAGFFLMAAGFAAAGTLLAHCFVDVPAHRWGTAGFALAALAIAAPLPRRLPGREPEWNPQGPRFPLANRRAALVPLAIGALWVLPFVTDWPQWSPSTLGRVMDQPNVPLPALEAAARWFPLNYRLHQIIGEKYLQADAGSPVWRNEFEIALRLAPGSWALPMRQARWCTWAHSDAAFLFWNAAIDRGGFRAEEIFSNAYKDTASLPTAAEKWASLVRKRPSLALGYARLQPPERAREYFDLWWETRGLSPSVNLGEQEIASFYDLARGLANPERLNLWMARHPERASADYAAWARLLHGWHDEAAAWQIMADRRPEPAWPSNSGAGTQAQLELRYKREPTNLLNAQALATTYHLAGDREKARQVIFQAARQTKAPEWFVRKAAYALAAQGKFSEAVETLLQEGAAPEAVPAKGKS